MVQIFTKQKYVPRNWSEVVFLGGGGFMIVVEEWGVGDGGERDGLIYGQGGLFCFVDLI